MIAHVVRDALQSITAHGFRSFLTMLGIIIGVASLIAMLSLGAGAQSRVASQIASIGTNLLVVFSIGGQGTTDDEGRPLHAAELTLADTRAIAETVPGVQHAVPSLETRAGVVHGNRNWETRVNGTVAEHLELREWPLASGRMFSHREESDAGKVAIVGHSVAAKLFGTENPIGREVRIHETPVRVIGVLEPKGPSGTGRDQDDIVFVPFKTVQYRLGSLRERTTPGTVSYILVKAVSEAGMDRAKRGIEGVLRQRQRIGPDMGAGFRISDPAATLAAQSGTTRTVGWLLAAIASISLVVGGISIMNIMLVSVTERRREIGLRMALGAKRSQIGIMFLAEALMICVTGGVLGVALGVGAAWGIAVAANWPVVILPSAVMAALGFAALVGLCFGLFPARRAAGLLPADALRSE